MTTTREQILAAALAVVHEGGTVSLESAARSAGLSKPGLMHHFRTKEALMLGLVDHVVERWDRELSARAPGGAERSDPRARYRAYVEWCLSGDCDDQDLVMLCDPRLRGPLTERWTSRLGPWLAFPDDLSEEARGRLTTARLLADGVWFADATGTFVPTDAEREHVRATAEGLLTA